MLFNYKEVIKMLGTDYKLKMAISGKILYKIEKGIYSDKRKNFTLPELLLKKYSNAFLVKESALHYIGFIEKEPEKVHLGTPRNALRINDDRVVQHFYSDFNMSEFEDGLFEGIEHILSIKNLHRSFSPNHNEIRLFNFKAMLYDYIRECDLQPFDEVKEVLDKFAVCQYFTDFDIDDFDMNLYRERISLESKIRKYIRLIDDNARERSWNWELYV